MGLFINHVNTVLGKLRESPITALSTDATTEAYRAQEAVRRAVNRVWNAKQWSFKIRSTVFSTVASTINYPLSGEVGEVFSILSSVSPYKISVISESTFDNVIPNPVESGNPTIARLFDMAGALEQPSSPGTVSISSGSALDTTQKVLVKGMIGTTYIDYEEISLVGVSSVAGTKTFTKILAITKSDSTAGVVTVTVGATTVGRLWPQEFVHRRRIMRLYPTPSSVLSVTLKHFGLPPYLTHAYEDTEIPTRWDYVVDQFAFAFALQAKGIEQSNEFQSQFNVATKFLETDMASEEYISAENIILPERINMGGNGIWGSLPAGYGFEM